MLELIVDMCITLCWYIILKYQYKFIWGIVLAHYVPIYDLLQNTLATFNCHEVATLQLLLEIKFKIIEEPINLTREPFAIIESLENDMDSC